MPVEARQGRHRQRYSASGERLVAGCIPVRVHGDGSRPEDVQILMISSRGGKGLCFPKGGWEDDESVEAAAKRETVEEAGVRGALELPMLGEFPFSSGKTFADTSTSLSRGCIAHIFVMHVAEELEVWPESHQRMRYWCPPLEASARCRYDWMRSALHAWMQRKGWTALLEQARSQPPAPLNLLPTQPSAPTTSIDTDVSTQQGSEQGLGKRAGSNLSVRGPSPS